MPLKDNLKKETSPHSINKTTKKSNKNSEISTPVSTESKNPYNKKNPMYTFLLNTK